MGAPVKIDPGLLEYASETQRRYIEAIKKHGSQRAAARALGINPSAIDGSMARLKVKASTQGYSPAHNLIHPVPEPYIAKGHSTLYDRNGNVAAQWVKTRIDDDRRLHLIKEAVAAMVEDVPPADPAPAPLWALDHLCNLYTMTDCHVGMLAWKEEAGADWDIEAAEAILTGCFQQMVEGAPPAGTAIINQLGDWLHFDGLAPVTPTSRHVLDASARFPLMVRAAVRILRRLVDMALAHHERVVLVVAEGNHDLASSVWLRAMFAALYENEPRCEVVQSELPFYVHQHGKVMLGFHHGHLKDKQDLPLLFAAQYPEAWGATTKRYTHVGHRHHTAIKEFSGMTVIQHPTLAARDAYTARSGYISERQATAYTYHAEHGQVASVTVTPEMLAA